MKIIDVRMRPPFPPYLGSNSMFDAEARHPFALSCFYRNFGAKMSRSMKSAVMEDLFREMDELGNVTGVVSIRDSGRGYENHELVKLLEKYPERFLGACGIPPKGSSHALETLQKYAVNGPCVAAFMEPGFRNDRR